MDAEALHDPDTRMCPRCAQALPRAEFGYRDRAQTRLQAYCRTCTASYHRAYYRRHRDRQIAAVTERRRRRIARNRVLVNEAKNKPCEDCGQSLPPAAMDLDHVRGPKVGDVSRLVYQAPTDVVVAEIAKCEVVCATCHRLRTLRRSVRRTMPLLTTAVEPRRSTVDSDAR